MIKNKTYYKKIFDKMIPRSKSYNLLSFSDCVNIDKFFKDLKIIDKKTFEIMLKKKCSTDKVIRLLGDYIIESYFLSKKTFLFLMDYEKKQFKSDNYQKNEIYLLNKLKKNDKKKL